MQTLLLGLLFIAGFVISFFVIGFLLAFFINIVTIGKIDGLKLWDKLLDKMRM